MNIHVGVHVKYPSFLLYFNKSLIFRQTFDMFTSTKFHEHLSSWNRGFPWECAGGREDGRTGGRIERQICLS